MATTDESGVGDITPPAVPRRGSELASGAVSPFARLQEVLRDNNWLPGGPSKPDAAPPLHASAMVSSVFINVLALALPLVILQVYDRILPNQSYDTLGLLLIGLAVVVVLDTVMKVARAYLVGWSAARYEHQVGIAAVERILNAPSPLIENDAPSVHVDRLNAVDSMREFYGGQSRLLLLDLPFIFIFLGLIGFVGGNLVLVPLALFVILGTATLMCGRSLREVLQNRSEFDDRKYDFIIEALSGIQTIKSMAMEPQFQRRFERLQKTGVDAAYKTIVLGNAAQSFGNLFANLTMISVVSVGAIFVIQGSLTVGTLACCTLLSGRTIQPLLKGLGLWTQLQSLSIAKGRIEELFSLPPVVETGLGPISECTGEIKVRGLRFAYSPDSPVLMDDICLDVAAGEIIAIKGDDGCGKSTLVRMMAGQFEPDEGDVRIDGYDVCGPWKKALSEWVAYVPQTSSMFHGTILQNITMFRTGEAIDAARQAAQLIGLETDIHRLPEGYDTPISEGITEELPSGLMQRIVIARALARQPKVLIFDEANGSLDARGDRLLREGLDKLRGEMTIVIVSLRPSFIKLADRVYELADGHLQLDPSSARDLPVNAATQSDTGVSA